MPPPFLLKLCNFNPSIIFIKEVEDMASTDGNYAGVAFSSRNIKKILVTTTATCNAFKVPNDYSSGVSVVPFGFELAATKVDSTGQFYYLDYYQAWIPVTSIKITNKDPDPSVDASSYISKAQANTIEPIQSATKTQTYASEFTQTASKGTKTTQSSGYTPSTSVPKFEYKLAENPVHYEANRPKPVEDKILDPGFSNKSTFINSSKSFGNLITLFGVPYQFLKQVDRPMNESTLDYSPGQIFTDKIIARNNLLFLTPGKPVFMKGFGDDAKKGVLGLLFSGGGGGGTEAVDSIISGYGRYYSMDFDWVNYYKYVDSICAATARFMNIQDVRMTIGNKSVKLEDVRWSEVRNSAFRKYITSAENVVFYLDGVNSVSESFSNSTVESQLVGQANGYSAMAREIQFLLGGDAGKFAEENKDGLAELGSAMTGAIGSLVSKGVIAGISKGWSGILHGGKLVFPELWDDSSFDRSYSINLKFVSPDPDPVSIFLNEFVPLIHLICMTAPRDFYSASMSNGFVAPFLVGACVRGLFNIDYGIITDLSIDKGGEGMWTLDSLPMQINVSLTIKDLYKNLYISSGVKSDKFIGNDGLMDYLMTMSGVNMAQPTKYKTYSVWWSLVKKNIMDIPRNLYNEIIQWAGNVLSNIY